MTGSDTLSVTSNNVRGVRAPNTKCYRNVTVFIYIYICHDISWVVLSL